MRSYTADRKILRGEGARLGGQPTSPERNAVEHGVMVLATQEHDLLRLVTGNRHPPTVIAAGSSWRPMRSGERVSSRHKSRRSFEASWIGSTNILQSQNGYPSPVTLAQIARPSPGCAPPRMSTCAAFVSWRCPSSAAVPPLTNYAQIGPDMSCTKTPIKSLRCRSRTHPDEAWHIIKRRIVASAAAHRSDGARASV
jgi:hypothetical protein